METVKKKTMRSKRAVGFDHSEQMLESVTLEQAMKDFVTAKRAERAAKRTIRDYETHFRYFLDWLEPRYGKSSVVSITPAIIREYVTWMSAEKLPFDDHPHRRAKKGIVGLSPMTVNVRIRTLKSFFNWCQKEKYTYLSPTADLKLQKVDEDKISAFTQAQLSKLLAAPMCDTFNGFRDYVIMAVLTDTGLRISELLGLRKQDVDFVQMTLTVPWEMAKTRKTRTVPISRPVAKLLAELIAENEDFGSGRDALFYSVYGSELTPDAFDERLKIYAKKANIEGVRCSAHTFRHTFALHWIKSGGDAFSLQKILGHTDMSMVRRYVRLSDTDVKEKHVQFSPMASILNMK